MSTITIEELAKRMNGKVWQKAGLSRIYLDKGYNTKKVKTKAYLYEKDGKWRVSVFIDAPSQHMNWINSQKEELEDSIDAELRVALADTFYYIEVDGKPVDEAGKPVESVAELYMHDDIFINEVLAGKKMEKRGIEGKVTAIAREDFDKAEDELRKKAAEKRNAATGKANSETIAIRARAAATALRLKAKAMAMKY